jgi:anti-sigma factor RsiW
MCNYPNRDGALIAYVYDELDQPDRASFDNHLPTCPACRDEVRALGGVRQQLAHWSPPEPAFMIGASATSVAGPQLVVDNPLSVPRRAPGALRLSTGAHPNPKWRQLPAWAQVAAALLFLGVSAGVANLEIHRDRSGWTIRTGWSRPAAPVPGAAAAVAGEAAATASHSVASPDANAVTRQELVALERQLRSEMRGVQSSSRMIAASDPRSTAAGSLRDEDLLRRVRALLDETEKRQNRELALRIGEVLRDVNAQRQADLVRIDRSLGLVQNDLGVEVMKQRQSLNYLMRVNQR